MIIKQDSALTPVPVNMEGAASVTMSIPIGPEDGSMNMVMRLLCVAPDGHTPYHTHNYEHVVRVVSGQGIVKDAKGEEHALNVGDSIFVPPNELHQFLNPCDKPFEFTCTILNQDKTTR